MSFKMTSIIEELDKIEPQKDPHLFVESRANHAIVSAINVLKLIQESFDEQEADELTRRFMNSIKGHDPRRFQRKIRELREGKNDK
jgi:hypothetical protein